MNATFSRQRQSIQVRNYNAMFEYRSTGSRITRVHFSVSIDPRVHFSVSIDPRVMENRFDLHENGLVCLRVFVRKTSKQDYPNGKHRNDTAPFARCGTK